MYSSCHTWSPRIPWLECGSGRGRALVWSSVRPLVRPSYVRPVPLSILRFAPIAQHIRIGARQVIERAPASASVTVTLIILTLVQFFLQWPATCAPCAADDILATKSAAHWGSQ